MTTVQEVIDRVRYQLNDKDSGNYRWDDPELILYVNDGLRETVVAKPDANGSVINHSLDAGVLQTVPSDGLSVIDITRNMGTDGSTPGRSIFKLEKRDLDQTYPDWPKAPKVVEIKNWVYNPSYPDKWFAFPPSDGTVQVEMVYSKLPTAVTAVGDPFPLNDEYLAPVASYLVFRAMMKDADYAANAERAMRAKSDFYQSLGRRDMAEMIYKLDPAQISRGDGNG